MWIGGPNNARIQHVALLPGQTIAFRRSGEVLDSVFRDYERGDFDTLSWLSVSRDNFIRVLTEPSLWDVQLSAGIIDSNFFRKKAAADRQHLRIGVPKKPLP